MSTRSTVELVQVVRTRLLTFAPLDGSATLGFRLGSRLYVNQAPKDAAYPFAVMRLTAQRTDGAYNGIRKDAELELLVYDKGAGAARSTVERCCDIAEQALFRLWLDAPGLVFSRQVIARDMLPPSPDVVDEQTQASRVLFQLVYFPQYLTLFDS